MYPAFLPFQLSRFARTGIWELLLIGAAKKLLKDTRSRVAQWKRAGPITQRSEDQNLALLCFFLNLFLRFFCFNFYLLFPCWFTNLKSFPSLFWNWKSKAAEAKWNQERILVNVGEFTDWNQVQMKKGISSLTLTHLTIKPGENTSQCERIYRLKSSANEKGYFFFNSYSPHYFF